MKQDTNPVKELLTVKLKPIDLGGVFYQLSLLYNWFSYFLKMQIVFALYNTQSYQLMT